MGKGKATPAKVFASGTTKGARFNMPRPGKGTQLTGGTPLPKGPVGGKLPGPGGRFGGGK